MDETRLADLNLALQDISQGVEHLESFGVFYIQHRLTLNYGTPYGLTFSGAKGEGTTATIVLPRKE
jgi:sensor histidine kinase YesM